jgi:hypothetical protein
MALEELKRELREHGKEIEEITVKEASEPTKYRVVFSQGSVICHNQLLERLRSLGYEVYCFGKNHRYYPENFTGTFVEV